VGTGPFRFSKWERGRSIELVADSNNYLGRPSLDRLVFAIAPDYRAAAARVIAGDADFCDAVDPTAPLAATSGSQARTIILPARQYTFLAFNFRERRGSPAPHPILGDRAVRSAIALAINRAAAVNLTLDTLARIANGPFVRSLSVADTTLRQIPFDQVRAARLLDSTGWRLPQGREFREKAGRRLEFRLLTPKGNNTRRQTALIAQADLRKVGISMVVDTQSYPVFASRLASRDFDAFFGAALAVPGSAGLQNIWNSQPGGTPGFLNLGSYTSPAFAAMLDSMNVEFNPARRKRLLGRVFQQITDDVAAIWMYEASETGLVHSRISIPSPQSFNWWSDIRNWSIDPARRIPRDLGGSY
jgi:peptide/nickel transport system substrate-binding protein